MSQNLARYHSRSPRYILQAQDNTLVRVAGPKQVPWEEGTEIRDVSLTGLSFTAPVDLCPIVGEVIKIQFDVPGANAKTACYAMVSRIEAHGRTKMVVGCQFLKLNRAQQVIISQGLSLKLKEQMLRSAQDRKMRLGFLAHYLPPTLLVLWLALFYVQMNFFESLQLVLHWARFFFSHS